MKKNSLPLKRKRLNRQGRLAAAEHWIPTYNGKNLISGYAKWYGVDKICAVTELKMLGVAISAEQEKNIITAHKLKVEKNRVRKENLSAENENPIVEYSDGDFVFIAGYTSGGAPYGITRD